MTEKKFLRNPKELNELCSFCVVCRKERIYVSIEVKHQYDYNSAPPASCATCGWFLCEKHFYDALKETGEAGDYTVKKCLNCQLQEATPEKLKEMAEKFAPKPVIEVPKVAESATAAPKQKLTKRHYLDRIAAAEKCTKLAEAKLAVSNQRLDILEKKIKEANFGFEMRMTFPSKTEATDFQTEFTRLVSKYVHELKEAPKQDSVLPPVAY